MSKFSGQFKILLSKYPLLRSLPVFLLGQVLEWYLGGISCIFSLLLVVIPPRLIGFRSFSGVCLSALSLNLGVLSSFRFDSSFNIEQLLSERSYIATVDENPRHPKVGQIRLSLNIEELAKENYGIGVYARSLGARVLCHGIDLPWRNPSNLVKGDKLIFRAKWSVIKKSFNPFSYESYLYRRGYVATCNITYATKAILKERSRLAEIQRGFRDLVYAINGVNEGSSLFLSMAIGARDVLGRETERAFKETGLAHLLVLSGYQITLVYGVLNILILYLLKKLSYRLLESGYLPKICAITAFFITASFTIFTGFEPSGIRALLAIAVIIISSLSERPRSYWHGVLAAFWGVNILWPLSFMEVGTQLTFAALVGIGLGMQISKDGSIRQLFIVSILASVMTAIVTLVWFKAFSPIGLIINPIVAPLLSWISCNCGFIALLFNTSGIDSNGILFKGVIYLLEQCRGIVEFLAALPCSYIEFKSRLHAILLGAFIVLICHLIYCRQRASDNTKRCRAAASLLDYQ